MTLAIRTLVLAAFGGRELLDIDIPTLVPIFFLLSLACPCLCYDEIKSKHVQNRHTGGGGKRSCKVTKYL